MKSLSHLLALFVFLVTPVLVKAQGQRIYLLDTSIIGNTADLQGVNYILLHKMYLNTLMDDSYVFGKITGIRGGAGAWNRKWTVEVNTSTAYNSTRGSIISYNEASTLVTLMFNGEKYLAATIQNSSSLFNFSFTGYAKNQTFGIAHTNQVSNVTPFTDFDPVTIQGNVGIGTMNTGSHKLAVDGSIGARKVKVTQADWADFVFQKDYPLLPLKEVADYIEVNKHLSGMPTTEEVQKDGIDVGEMNKLLLQKIEELTLYLIEENKQRQKMQDQIDTLQSKIKLMEKK